MADNSPIICKEVLTAEQPLVMEDHKPKMSTSESEPSTAKSKFELNINFAFSCTFNVPPTMKALFWRVLRNIKCFKVHYDLFVLAVLLITLFPEHMFSLLLVLINTVIMLAYLRLLKAFPNSTLLKRWIDTNLVKNIVIQATVVEMFITGAGYHMFFTLVGTFPIILLHLVLHDNEVYTPVVSDLPDKGDKAADAV